MAISAGQRRDPSSLRSFGMTILFPGDREAVNAGWSIVKERLHRACRARAANFLSTFYVLTVTTNLA